MLNEFRKVSRWLYQSENYLVSTSIIGRAFDNDQRWKVTRRGDGQVVGYATDIDAAIRLANDDALLQSALPAESDPGITQGAAEERGLTPRHERAIMVVEARTDERTAPMAEFNECQCFSTYRVEQRDGQEIRIYESCGSTIPRKRRFKPGHDAKLKSALLREFRAGVPFTHVVDGVEREVDPKSMAVELGWGHFMTPKPKKTAKKVKADTAKTEPQGFHPARVKVGRWWKDGNIVAEDRDAGTVTVEYKDKKGSKQVTLDRESDKLEIG